MSDMTSFEGRLTTLFEAYADRAPVGLDEGALKEKITTARRGPLARIFGTHFRGRPRLASVLLAMLLIAALAASVLIGAMLITHGPLPVRPLSIQPTGFMTQQRAGAAAVRLTDDRVLIVAGRNTYSGANQSFAEIYDPAVASFVATGLVEPRNLVGGSATLLDDGRVLFVGGTDDHGAPVGLALLYDPQTDSFATLSAMLAPRSGQSAVLLADGRVAIIGGLRNAALAPSDPVAEYFDPGSLSFSAGPDADLLRRGRPVAFPANGTRLVVLIRGEPLLPASGAASVLNFDSATGEVAPASISPPDDAPNLLIREAVQLADRRIALVVTATDSASRGNDQVLLFDPADGSFSDSVDLGGVLVAGPTALADGRVIVGEHAADHCGDVFAKVFNPRDGSLVRIGQIGGIGGCVLGPGATITALDDGTALIAGGYMSSGQDTSAASLIHP